MLRATRLIASGSTLLVFGAVGCGSTDSTPPVATAAVTLNRTRVPQGGPLEMTYRFTVVEGARGLAGDYRVFVHFFDDDGALLFSDNHEPPQPMSSWQPCQQITYDRRMIVPVYPYIGEVTIAIGLYSATMGDRLPLMGEPLGQRAYRVATMEMAPQPESRLLVFEDGWHQVESLPGEPDREWQWTAGQATISFRNPRADSTLYLELDGRPDLFDVPQVVTLTIDETVVATIEVASEAATYHSIPVSAASLGAADTVTLTLNVDRTFVPADLTDSENPDQRELGVQVFYAFMEQN